MTQENIELLVKDLAGRVPYGVFVKKPENDSPGRLISVQIPCYCVIQVERNQWFFDEYDVNKQVVKPYLRPMSSMTEEERDEFRNLGGVMSHDVQNDTWALSAFSPEAYDWLFAHHFDIHDLIKKGLALEAPEGLYA